jgi:Ca2+/Na+ antiporter
MRYIYFRIYQQLKKVKTNDTPAFNAMGIFGIFQMLNIASIFGIANHFIKVSLSRNQVVVCGIIFFVLLFIPNFMYFFRKKDEICKQYENETKEERRRGTVYLLLYIILSVAVFFTIGETLIR